MEQGKRGHEGCPVMVGVCNSTPSSRRQYHLYRKKEIEKKSHAGATPSLMPRCNLAEILTVDVRSRAGDEVMIILHPAVLTIVLVSMAMLTTVSCPL
jgi:hypothetical protein